MYLHGFQERMFSIQEQCIFVSVYGFCFDLWVSLFPLKRLSGKNCFTLEWQFLGCQPMFPSLLGLQLACMQHIIYCHASPALTHAEKDTWVLDYKLLGAGLGLGLDKLPSQQEAFSSQRFLHWFCISKEVARKLVSPPSAQPILPALLTPASPT